MDQEVERFYKIHEYLSFIHKKIKISVIAYFIFQMKMPSFKPRNMFCSLIAKTNVILLENLTE